MKRPPDDGEARSRPAAPGEPADDEPEICRELHAAVAERDELRAQLDTCGELAVKLRAEVADIKGKWRELRDRCEAYSKAADAADKIDAELRAEVEKEKQRAAFGDELLKRVVIHGGSGSWTHREMFDWCCDYGDHENGYPADFIQKQGHKNCQHRRRQESSDAKVPDLHLTLRENDELRARVAELEKYLDDRGRDEAADMMGIGPPAR